jgi:hypothetical protein
LSVVLACGSCAALATRADACSWFAYPVEALSGVTSVSFNEAWGWGYDVSSSPVTPYLEHFTNGLWSSVPLPTGFSGFISAISARSSNDVWLAGYTRYPVTAPGGSTELAHWNGTRWSTVATPVLPKAFTSSVFYGVDAALPSPYAWAVGAATTSSGTYGLIEHFNGTYWELDRQGLQANVQFNSIAGRTLSELWVGGETSGPAPSAVLERWNAPAFAWQAVTTAPYSSPILTHSMAAVGNAIYIAGSGTTAGPNDTIEEWTGSSWQTLAAPAASGGTVYSFDVGWHLWLADQNGGWGYQFSNAAWRLESSADSQQAFSQVPDSPEAWLVHGDTGNLSGASRFSCPTTIIISVKHPV